MFLMSPATWYGLCKKKKKKKERSLKYVKSARVSLGEKHYCGEEEEEKTKTLTKWIS